jgi:hypothetical protein
MASSDFWSGRGGEPYNPKDGRERKGGVGLLLENEATTLLINKQE